MDMDDGEVFGMISNQLLLNALYLSIEDLRGSKLCPE